MKFAKFNGNKSEAVKGGKGICQICDSEVIAKCGEVRIEHWAHKSNRICDSWWEPETEWHRNWKNHYPEELQEVPMKDKDTNEKHIADIRTKNELVIEFQHSHIPTDERISREEFYKKMVWVVDGTRLKNDFSRFIKKSKKFYNTDDPQIFHFDINDESFPSAWLGSTVPVLIDFKGITNIDDPENPRNFLYCLQPNIKSRNPFFAKLTHQEFINLTVNGDWESTIKKWFDRPNKYDLIRQKLQFKEELQTSRINQPKSGLRWREILPAILLFIVFILFLKKFKFRRMR